MTEQKPTSQKKINPLFGLIFTILITVLGMISVYIAGNARGYDPSLAVLVRNSLMISAFLVVYLFLKRGYKGDFTILIVVALLTGIGFIIQYRISSAINIDFQKTLIRQYSAAGLEESALPDSTQHLAASDSTVNKASEERSLQAIQKEAEQFLKLDKLKFSQVMQDFFNSVPSWSRLIISYLIALYLIIHLVRKCSDNRFMDSLARPFFWVTLTVFLLFIFVALSEVGTRGRFVYQMTPWEAFKVTIIIFLAGFFAKYKDEFTRKAPKIKGKKLQRIMIPWGPFLLIWLIPQLLFILLKDFGQVIIYGGLVIIMVFVLTRKYIFLFGGIAITVLTSRLILLLEGIAPAHVMKRFIIWSDIWAEPHNNAWWDSVYQIMNSFFALNAGGWTGAGLGLGYPTNIPLVVSDFVYSAISEELGFFGAAIIVFLYLALVFLGIRIVLESDNDFERLLATGFTTMLAVQVFVNIGGVIKLIPLTGITLPFISRGGFSFLVSMVIIGFLMGLSHRNGKRAALEA